MLKLHSGGRLWVMDLCEEMYLLFVELVLQYLGVHCCDFLWKYGANDCIIMF